MGLGCWIRFKSWMRRSVIRMVLRFARTRFIRFVRRIARASAVPVFITGGGAAVGAGVASTVASPVVYGVVIGASIGAAGLFLRRLYLNYAERTRARQQLRLNYTIWSKKESSTSGRTYVVQTTTTPRRF